MIVPPFRYLEACPARFQKPFLFRPNSLSDIPRIPDRCEAMIVPLGVFGNGKSRSVWGKRRSKPPVDCSEPLKRAAFPASRRTLPSSPVTLSDPHLTRAPHAGAGGARNRAMSDRISANIRRDTATSERAEDTV
jgi:hypothetical protein